MSITVTTFYQFTPIAEPATHKASLLARMQELGVKGTVTLAREGVNATVSGVAEGLNQFIEELKRELGMTLPMSRESYTGEQPFKRSKVKVKNELISLGAEANPSVCVGTYVEPADWNRLVTQPGVVTVDTRNDYEYEMGRFKGALNPATVNFKHMVRFTEETLKPMNATAVAMYCTGGIRCEKYSAYLLTQGYERVYHLRGGILAYLEQIPESQSLWEGTCFVFDERRSVGHGLTAHHATIAP